MHAGNRCFLEIFGSGTLFFRFSILNVVFTLSKLRFKVNIKDDYDFDTIMALNASKYNGT